MSWQYREGSAAPKSPKAWGCDCPIATDIPAACNFELWRIWRVTGRASALQVVRLVVLDYLDYSISQCMYRVNEAPPWENHRITSGRASQGLLQSGMASTRRLTSIPKTNNNESALNHHHEDITRSKIPKPEAWGKRSVTYTRKEGSSTLNNPLNYR